MRVNEIFYSLQGEGFHTGTPAVFVRLSGCNRRCPFCDTSHESHTEMSEEDITSAVAVFGAPIAVITGGEPAMQLTSSLVDRLHALGMKVHVETNGSLPLPDNVDWVTCSPKGAPYGIRRIDELKIVYQGRDPEVIAAQLPHPHVWSLQPLAAKDGSANVAATVDYIKRHPRWRLSLQTHKLINIP